MRKLLVALFVVLAAGAGFFFALLTPVYPQHPYTVSFVVLPGEGLEEIATNLETLGLIRERRAFMALVLLKRQSRDLKAGPYRARSDEWAWEILARLVEGDFQDTSITVPEGLWMTEVAEVVAPFVEGGADSFAVAARDSLFLAGLGVPAATAEGYLFPETYRLISGTPARFLVGHMVRTFLQVWRSELAARADSVGISLEETVTLASIVEAEARVAAERPRIAAVYLNRLERGYPLQADPTVHYALGERLPRTLFDDLKVASPYNTYLHLGLPPGPIGNPGEESLRAVLWPLPDSEELYFVALGDGSHLFARDYAGHLQNRRLVRQRRQGALPTSEEP